MNSPSSARQRTDSTEERMAPEERESGGLFGTIRLFFAHDRLANALWILTIVIGYFHGWLKIRFRASWVTFAFDVPLVLAWLVTVFSVGKGRSLFPNCNTSRLLMGLTAVGIAYVVLPFGMPLTVGLAAFRGWCFIPLVFLIGYHLTRSVRQIEVYMWFLLILAMITCFYGMFFQTIEEVMELMKNDPEFNFRLSGQFYSDSNGVGTFRRFSTFVSSAAFGGALAYSIVFAISRLTFPGCGWGERIFLVLSSLFMSYGVVLSGSRSAIVTLVVGFGFTVWYRRGARNVMLLPITFAGIFIYGVIRLGGGSAERFATLGNPEILLTRLYIVAAPGIENLIQYPMGGGLGRSGHGLPVIMYTPELQAMLRLVDGDMGRYVVDMGIIGLILFVLLVVVGITDALKWMEQLRNTMPGLIALPAGSMFILGCVQLSYGSPFLGIPNGVLLWFFMGSLRRLVEDYGNLKAEAGQEAADTAPQFASFIAQNRVIPLYRQASRGLPGKMRGLTNPGLGSTALTPRTATARIGSLVRSGPKTTPGAVTLDAPTRPAAGPIKRFLFRRPSDTPDRRKKG